MSKLENVIEKLLKSGVAVLTTMPLTKQVNLHNKVNSQVKPETGKYVMFDWCNNIIMLDKSKVDMKVSYRSVYVVDKKLNAQFDINCDWVMVEQHPQKELYDYDYEQFINLIKSHKVTQAEPEQER